MKNFLQKKLAIALVGITLLPAGMQAEPISASVIAILLFSGAVGGVSSGFITRALMGHRIGAPKKETIQFKSSVNQYGGTVSVRERRVSPGFGYWVDHNRLNCATCIMHFTDAKNKKGEKGLIKMAKLVKAHGHTHEL